MSEVDAACCGREKLEGWERCRGRGRIEQVKGVGLVGEEDQKEVFRGERGGRFAGKGV